MRYEIVFTLEAIEDLKQLRGHERPAVRDTIEQTLRFVPTKTSRSRIKQSRGLSKPQYRLENDPRFLARIAQARESYRTCLEVRIEDVALDDEPQTNQ